MLRAARALLAMRHPLDAELAFSELLGTWWGERLPGVDVERLLGEGLITHATASGKPAGLGVLAAITALGTSASQRELAEQGMIALRERGLQAPAWAAQLGAVTPVAVYVSNDRFGDTDDVVCLFSRDAPDSSGSLPPEHALILVLDHNSGGLLRDVWVTTKVDLLLKQCRERARGDDFARFEQLELSEARALLSRALERTERVVTGAAADPSAGPTVEPVGISAADLTGGSLAAHFALWLPSLRMTSVASSVTLVTTTPIWITLLLWLRGHRPSARTWLGTLVAFAGVVLLTGVDLNVSARALAGDALALAGGLAAAFYILIGNEVRRNTSTTGYTFVCYGTAAATLLLACLATGTDLTGYSAMTWLKLALLTLTAQLLGHSLLNRVVRGLGPSVTSTAILLEAPGAALIAALWLGQTPAPAAYPALAVILLGLALVIRAERAPLPPAPLQPAP
jgi:drug/metabolite transporter (DMT)-like permease